MEYSEKNQEIDKEILLSEGSDRKSRSRVRPAKDQNKESSENLERNPIKTSVKVGSLVSNDHEINKKHKTEE
jgi:hypothetical protein